MNNTNFIGLWEDLELEEKNVLLWLMYHQGRYDLNKLINDRDDWQIFEKIILLDQEADQIKLNNDPRVHLIEPTIDSRQNKHTFLWWYEYVQKMEKLAGYLTRLTDNKNKTTDYMFDALFGTMRLHKELLLDHISNSKYQSKFILSSRSNNKHITGFPNDNLSGVTINGEQYPPCSVSSVIPYLIYNNSWYTISCETTFEGVPFYTEKTAKPLLAKRIFVLVGNQYHIKGLKSFGFKTFDRIIDESFDNYEQVEDRCKGAWDQIEWMLEQDPLELYEKVEDILEHNQQLILNTDYLQQLKTIVHNIINT